MLLGPEHHYEAQSGLTGDGGPNHRTLWSVQPGNTTLGAGEETLEVRLDAQGKDGLAVTKLYRFKRDSYVIDVALEIRNAGAQPRGAVRLFPADARRQVRRGLPMRWPTTFGAQSFNGFAVYSEEKKFQKVPLTDIDKGKADFIKQANDGWFAYVQHYFVAGWLPAAKVAREYAMEKRATASTPAVR